MVFLDYKLPSPNDIKREARPWVRASQVRFIKKEISRAIWTQIDNMGGDGSWHFHPQKYPLLFSCPGVISGHIASSGFDLR